MRQAWMGWGAIALGLMGLAAIGCGDSANDGPGQTSGGGSINDGTGGSTSSAGTGSGGSGGGGGGGGMSVSPCGVEAYPKAPELAAEGAVIYVSSQCGSDKGDGTVELPFPTLGAGVSAAKPGDVVLVMRGTKYTENVVIQQPVSIIGEDEGKTGDDATIIVQSPNPNAILVDGTSGVLLRGIIVQSPQGSGIWVQKGSATIDGVRVEGATKASGAVEERGNGIVATDSSSIIVQRTIIVQSSYAGVLMTDSRGTVSSSLIAKNSGVAGIWVQRSSGWVTLTGNDVTDNTGVGMAILSSQAIIVQNTVKDTVAAGGSDRADGIVVAEHLGATGISEGPAEASLSGNVISGNDRLGILYSGDARGIIVQNEVKANADDTWRGAGIWVQSGAGALSPINVQQNDISGNAFTNVGVHGSARAIIVQNPSIGASPATPWEENGTKVDCGEGISLFAGATATIEGNTIASNARSGIFLDAAAIETSISGNTIWGSEFAIIVQNQLEAPQLASNEVSGPIDIVAQGIAGHLVPHGEFDLP